MIYTEGLCKVFDREVKAVDELNLETPSGEIFGLLGPNGAGKTTTIRLLSCILEPTAGEAVVADLSVRDDREQIRQQIGLLSETPSLYERLSSRKNLQSIGRLYGLTLEQVNHRIDDLSSLLEFQQYLDVEAGKLSKGNKHKVAIARAMLHEPRVLFLDEPTSSLDPEMALVVRETIEKLTDSYNSTVLICTHNLHEAERLCDRVGIINNGHLLSVGTLDDLFQEATTDLSVEVELVNFSEDFLSVLHQVTGIQNIQADSNSSTIVFDTEDPINCIPDVVETLVRANARVLSVNQRKHSLEDLYFDIIGRGDQS